MSGLCPLGQVGDRLWVRETYACIGLGHYIHKATDESDYPDIKKRCRGWRPSIHMPRHVSRITLEITNIRVERLQEINEEDAKREGIGEKDTVTVSEFTTKTYRRAFEIYWDNMHTGRWKNKTHKEGSRWQDNPWVWVIEFKRVQEINQ